MNYRNLGLLVLAGLLTACASQDGADDSYVDWVCSGSQRSDNWSCEMHEMRDGQPVVHKAQAAEVAPATAEGAASDKKTLAQPIQEVAGFPSQDWRQQLPSLTKDPVIVDEQGNAAPVAAVKSRPPRVAEPVAAARPESRRSTSPVQDQPVVHTLADSEQGLRAADVSGARSGYTLQLGAFSDEPQLQAFVAAHHLDQLPVKQFRAFSKNQYWQVLTWGEFASPEDAHRAWQEVAKRYPGIAPWVRAVSSLDNAAASAAEVDG